MHALGAQLLKSCTPHENHVPRVQDALHVVGGNELQSDHINLKVGRSEELKTGIVNDILIDGF